MYSKANKKNVSDELLKHVFSTQLSQFSTVAREYKSVNFSSTSVFLLYSPSTYKQHAVHLRKLKKNKEVPMQ